MDMTPWPKAMTAGCRPYPAVAEPTVGAGFARGLYELALAKGAPRGLLLEQSGLAAGDLADQDARVPFARYVALMRAAKALTGDEALGLHYGEQVNIADVSIVGLIGLASETMLDAFLQLNRYVQLIVETDRTGPGDRFQSVGDRQGLWMVDTRRNPNAFPELTESAFAQLICGPRKFDDARFALEVQVTHERPAHAAEYERIFRCPVTFGAARNAFRVDEAWAARPVARLPRYVFGVLSEKAAALLAELESARTTRGRVEGLLMPVLHKGEANIDCIAAKLGMSRQTLFRRLKAEGATFVGVLDELRHKLALHYLSGEKVSVNETAYLVGFSDPAAFSRAFKRWTGASPRTAKPPKH
jgi:AraC-like DNA-binding protein